MNFNNQLNQLINEVGCSSKELAVVSGLSPAVISRYRNGERLPSTKSPQLEMLAKAISNMAEQKGITNLTEDKILLSLVKSLNHSSIDFDLFRKKLNEIISIFSINISELSKTLNFDSSYISKIRTGKRTPANIDNFINALCNFIVNKYSSIDEKKSISILIGCLQDEILEQNNYFVKMKEWFTSSATNNYNDIDTFLKKLDEFDLNEYIKVIHFDKLKVPSIPFYKPTTKNYYGIEQMKQGELDFFKATVISKSYEPVFMCNDMPMDDMAEDTEFGKKWMFAIAMTLKKGLHLNMIHNLDRPFNELLIGLESWIPIYMTGQISPFYLKGIQNSVYCHFNYVSGKIALTGECLNGFHNNGKYYLTTNTEEVEYYKTKAKNLLSKSQPLMEIYSQENKNAFDSFMITNSKLDGNIHRMLSTLPIHTISDNLLLRILKRNNISNENIEKILNFVKYQRETIEIILKNNFIIDELSEISKEIFNEEDFSIFLADSFYEDKILYNYNEYLEHLNLTKEYAKNKTNYSIKISTHSAFKNIQITSREGKWVMISKNTNPSIHFVIRHPKLRYAIEKFIPLIID